MRLVQVSVVMLCDICRIIAKTSHQQGSAPIPFGPIIFILSAVHGLTDQFDKRQMPLRRCGHWAVHHFCGTPNSAVAHFSSTLRMLHAAHSLIDLRAPPGNRLEALRGDQAGQYSIRGNDQFRITFRFEGGNADEVVCEDYHLMREAAMIPTHRAPTMPGIILLEEFLKPLGLSQVEAAQQMGVPLNRLNEIIRGRRGVTADTALRLARLLDTTPEFWMNLQTASDLYRAARALEPAKA